jgi:hypothetical protein
VILGLANSSNPVASISLQYESGGGHSGILAVAGSTGAGFTPIGVTGYTEDIIAEANAAPAPDGLNATTATMDAGTANTGFSWYETGYNPSATTTGLPTAGTTLTNLSALDHVYTLPAAYTNNNAVLVDTAGGGQLAFATPPRFRLCHFSARPEAET